MNEALASITSLPGKKDHGGVVEDFRSRGLCAQTDPEAFFPSNGNTRAAKKVCMACPVRDECLEFALANKENHGVWGGLSESQRLELLQDRLAATADAAELKEAS